MVVISVSKPENCDLCFEIVVFPSKTTLQVLYFRPNLNGFHPPFRSQKLNCFPLKTSGLRCKIDYFRLKTSTPLDQSINNDLAYVQTSENELLVLQRRKLSIRVCFLFRKLVIDPLPPHPPPKKNKNKNNDGFRFKHRKVIRFHFQNKESSKLQWKKGRFLF